MCYIVAYYGYHPQTIKTTRKYVIPNINNLVEFEVLTAMFMKITIFWIITPCISLKVNSACYLLHADFLRGLLIDPDDGGNMPLRNAKLTFKVLHGIISQKKELFINNPYKI
jgi:hypothetical protein